MRRIILTVAYTGYVVTAALAGLLIAAANRWGASQQSCDDTLVPIVAESCAAQSAPLWALVLTTAVAAVLAIASLEVGRRAVRRG
ncbi:MAG TPA: hypothetical protein VK988_15540 [Acidimicrobiales bacterium]|nr:hypothetical protein [Acidimicrobiales bacterium]